eukprot:1851472-Rhodomonas_salina.2
MRSKNGRACLCARSKCALPCPGLRQVNAVLRRQQQQQQRRQEHHHQQDREGNNEFECARERVAACARQFPHNNSPHAYHSPAGTWSCSAQLREGAAAESATWRVLFGYGECCSVTESALARVRRT